MNNTNENKSTDLTFSALRRANDERAIIWLNGKPPMSMEFSVIELCGEVGELANKIKKLLRHRAGIPGGSDNMEEIEEELADVVICADLLGKALKIDLAQAVAKKFNKTSDKHGFATRLPVKDVK